VVGRAPDGTELRGVASNWLCDLPLGAEVGVVGPFGATFLMPDDPDADIVMVCTGTGAAPFRGFTERRRRTGATGRGRLHLYFGARTPQELPYFGPLQKVPSHILEQNLVYSRLPGAPREYVQDRMRGHGERLARLLAAPGTHLFLCGLRGLEAGVDAALTEACRGIGQDWAALRNDMRQGGRYHAETY
jgi:benzoyl-CoA 2,3-dioxygenase component A